MGIEPREHALERILGKHIHLDRVNVVALDLLHDPSDEFEIAQGRGGGDRHQGNGGKTQYNANGNQLRSPHGPTLVPSFVSSPMRRLSELIGGAYRGAGCKGTGHVEVCVYGLLSWPWRPRFIWTLTRHQLLPKARQACSR